jgi:hypothetical protein
MLRNVARTYRALGNPTTGVSLASDFGPSSALHSHRHDDPGIAPGHPESDLLLSTGTRLVSK